MQTSEAIETWKQWEGHVVGGQFSLHEYLGSNGRSAVFTTEMGGADRVKAAIKLLPGDLEDAETHLARWRKAAKLSHRHLLRVFGMGRCKLGDTEFIYIVMEYAEENLAQILPQRSLTPTEAQQLIDSTADALIYLHNQGLVHGHIKPANIMAVNDQLKISTDGVVAAGAQNARSQATVYDAPEVAMGTIAPASDVWSLGVTMVEALSQRAPVGREKLFLPNTVPPHFADIARHCLVRDPQSRWTLPQIVGQLQPSPAAPAPTRAQEPVTAEIEESGSKRRFVLPVIAVMALLITMLAGPRLFRTPPRELKSQSSSGQNPSAANTEFSPTSVKSEPLRASGSGIVPGSVLHQVLPNVSQSARNTIEGKVRVRVKLAVDESGNVTEASFLLPGPSKYFARLAMQASRDWKFTPPQANGQQVPSEWVLKFAFGRTATEVYPAQQSPSSQ
jgi:TonB family protein